MNISLKNQLLCSTIKVDNRISNYGSADVFNLSVLSMIYNLIDCNINISHECSLKLNGIVDKLTTNSSDICKIRGENVILDSPNVINIIVKLNTPPSVDDVDLLFDNGEYNYIFGYSDFTLNFTDSEGDSPQLVRIVSLPATGILRFNNTIISAGYIFNITDINKLKYTRTTDEYEDSFIFQTSDNNTINKLFSNMATFTITVEGQVNQPPSAVGDGTATTSYGVPIVFTRAMFTTLTTPPYADPDGDAAGILRIDSLPDAGEGTLKLSGANVSVLDEITFTDIDSGLFTFVPNDAVTTGYVPDFDFSIADVGSGLFTS